MNLGKRSLVVLCLVVGLLVAAVPAWAQTQSEKPLVPDFTLMSNQGEAVSLSDFAGQVVVLNFWASWCPPCKAEMPELQRLHDELQETGEAVLLLLNQIDGVRETEASGSKYLADNDFSFINLYDHGLVGGGIFGLPGIPTTVVIDAEGYMDNYIIGPTTYAAVKRLIEEAR